MERFLKSLINNSLYFFKPIIQLLLQEWIFEIESSKLAIWCRCIGVSDGGLLLTTGACGCIVDGDVLKKEIKIVLISYFVICIMKNEM